MTRPSPLKAACAAAGLTIRDVAAEVGCTAPVMYQVSTGRVEPWPKLRKDLADVFGYDPFAAGTTYDAHGQPVEVTDLPIEPPQEKNRRSIEDRLRQRLDTNRDYLALTSPTAAQQRAQVARLTRETNALIRLVLGLLDTDDTGD